jgi:hypothetical protein
MVCKTFDGVKSMMRTTTVEEQAAVYLSGNEEQ